MRTAFLNDDSIKTINDKIRKDSSLSDKSIQLAVDLGTKSAWENSLVTEIDEIPFHFTGKGTQCIVKTDLALSNKRAVDSSIILLEEPESHLSHVNLNNLIQKIKERFTDKQIIVTTHSSFVANKLNLKKLILLHKCLYVTLADVSPDTEGFFEKISGYDTLRYILCKKAILVEGASDELVIQKAYRCQHSGHLPIEDGIEVISVGVAFLRFLNLADVLKKPTAIVSDNDGDIDSIHDKYANYIGENKKPYVDICIDEVVDSGSLMIGKAAYNYNTLEPKLLKANSMDKLNTIFGTSYSPENDLRKYMKHNKTECALAIFHTEQEIDFPDYIREAVQ
jgi:putative ATP-dependent endonuclease of OLD family